MDQESQPREELMDPRVTEKVLKRKGKTNDGAKRHGEKTLEGDEKESVGRERRKRK